MKTVEEVEQWINSAEYKEKNFERKHVVINPARTCQPLGAFLVARGFKGALPFVHGSQGCAAYFRSILARHFREPVPGVSTSMTEDAAVFGGLNNLVEGMLNAYALYKPTLMPVFTTCMPEVIGDDLRSYIDSARQKEAVPVDLPLPYANTPSFIGSHINGYDGMLLAILQYFTEGRSPQNPPQPPFAKGGVDEGGINIIPGFDPFTGNLREYRRILELFGEAYILLGDYSETFDSPLTGKYDPYPGGTTIEETMASINAKATIALQKFSSRKTAQWLKTNYSGETVILDFPIGIGKTDHFLKEVSRLTGKPVPEALQIERGIAVDAMTDAQQYLHGKKFSLFGDPDYLLGLVSFLMEMGARPRHILCSNGNKLFEKDMSALLESTPFGQDAEVFVNKDLWHLRSLLVTDPVDMLIGSTHGKFAARDAEIPLLRVGFPIYDRVNSHRYPVIGYQGVINLVTWIANTFIDIGDQTADDGHFELMR